ncbi:hypothetical protein Pth03_45650 [Planotetraspora thailandica]|uniref:Uncharacterized protein n=1 Tax=Planotetraspora thailandica TaxID=487172 RepID=A0A8J3V761_9ACTN|nr:hypothetical protein Pth03_45650 [Planotetraspora thailandica]
MWSADVEIVGDEGFEEAFGAARKILDMMELAYRVEAIGEGADTPALRRKQDFKGRKSRGTRRRRGRVNTSSPW